jgi:ABC-type dipeptide/oligopeptide/nickel transport system ATPase subunit
MPPKRKKKPNKTANVGLQISGSEAIQLKNEIQDKGIKNMSGGTLQRILGISQCFDFEGESLKGCKVRNGV